jgi:hypothetical protein
MRKTARCTWMRRHGHEARGNACADDRGDEVEKNVIDTTEKGSYASWRSIRNSFSPDEKLA